MRKKFIITVLCCILLASVTAFSSLTAGAYSIGKMNFDYYNDLSEKDSFYIDDMSISAEKQQIIAPYITDGMNMIENNGFESGELSPFSARGCTVSVSAGAAHSGSLGASITERTQHWNGIEIDVKDMLGIQCNYEAKAWIRLDDTSVDSASFYMQLEISEQGYDTRYPVITKFTAKQGEWTEVRGVFSTGNFAYPVNTVKLYIGSADNNICSFSIDDVSLAYTTDEVKTWTGIRNLNIQRTPIPLSIGWTVWNRSRYNRNTSPSHIVSAFQRGSFESGSNSCTEGGCGRSIFCIKGRRWRLSWTVCPQRRSSASGTGRMRFGQRCLERGSICG